MDRTANDYVLVTIVIIVAWLAGYFSSNIFSIFAPLIGWLLGISGVEIRKRRKK